ncbi:sugar kinase [Eubacteriales bacterium OttesenSCG-928-G02]|nr:sugar kinase [Eubacteriales bacterium OttesenSCG-928-G02]
MFKKVVTFGEIMLRLQPPSYKRILQTSEYEATYGGGEANVAVSLSQYGVNAAFVTALPDNPVGTACRNELRRWGVDTSNIITNNGRMGIYFCEKGASQRPSVVVYDRKYSAISITKPGDFNWADIFKDVQWFHFTGITPALGEDVAALCLEAVKYAREHGILVSCDLNYRKKLWSKEQAKQTMSELCKYVDVLIANEEDCSDVFGINAENTDINSGSISHDGYIEVAKQVKAKFGCKYIAITLRESISATINNWAGMLYDGDAYFSDKYTINIVDRVGGGDSFGAGLIYSLIHGKTPQQAIDFAVAASCLKHTVEGDFNVATVTEVINLINNGGSGRVQR